MLKDRAKRCLFGYFNIQFLLSSKGQFCTEAFALLRRCIMEITIIIAGGLLGIYLYTKFKGNNRR